jgi:hypothetical protein
MSNENNEKTHPEIALAQAESAFRYESSRDKPHPLSFSSLPGDALIEFVVRCRLGLRVGFPLGLFGRRQLPQRGTARGRQTRG